MQLLGADAPELLRIAFSPDGRTLAAGSVTEAYLYLWELDNLNGQAVQPPSALLDHIQGQSISGIKFGVQGDSLIYGGNTMVYVMDLKSRRRRLTLPGNKIWIGHIALSKNGIIAVSGTGNQIRLYDSTSGQPRSILHHHRSQIAFDATGTRLYSAGRDGERKVWDVASQRCLDTVQSVLPYTGMNIAGATGLNEAQRASLRALGAVDAP